MKVLFLTGNKNKVVEANQILSNLGYEVEQFLVDGLTPKFIEPQSSSIAEVSEFKIQQALELISETESSTNALLVEDSGLFIESLIIYSVDNVKRLSREQRSAPKTNEQGDKIKRNSSLPFQNIIKHEVFQKAL